MRSGPDERNVGLTGVVSPLHGVRTLHYLVSTFSAVAPFFVLLSVWFSVVDQYWVRSPKIEEDAIRAMSTTPRKPLLQELIEYDLAPYEIERKNTVYLANRLVGGTLELPGLGVADIALPYDSNDLIMVPAPMQLSFASLVGPDILLRAYQETGDERYFRVAREILLGWIRYERSALIPKGLNWNDHAVSARVGVFARFWDSYRSRDDFSPEIAGEVLQAVARTGEFLAKRSHFTAATNHGVMQNLALIQLSLAFPWIPRVAEYKALGIERLEMQMNYYIDEEGVVLEHSAQYQEFGLELLAIYARYMTLMDMELSENWIDKYQKALAFYRILRRADGTLPKYGDTSGPARNVYVAEISDNRRVKRLRRGEFSDLPSGAAFMPIAGYAVWWDSESGSVRSGLGQAQTIMLWSRFPSGAHKHADDLSLIIWASGRSWITNSGYWPYSSVYRDRAVDWAGSNAPHFIDEDYDSRSVAKALGHAYSRKLAVIDLERRTDNGRMVRRQIVRIFPLTWVVIDSFNDVDTVDRSIVWTSDEGLLLRRGKVDNDFLIKPPKSSKELRLSILSEASSEIRIYKGELDPFRGWTIANGQPEPVPAVEIRSQTAKWLMSLFSIGEGGEDSAPQTPAMTSWESPESWTVELSVGGNEVSLERRGESIAMFSKNSSHRIALVQLQRPRNTSVARKTIERQYRAAMEEFPQYRSHLPYRTRLSWIIGVVWLLQELVAFTIRRARRVAKTSVRVVSVMCWGALGIWIPIWYFG